jgi:hypothetical protein
MSLINEALKKAARQRAEEQADVIPPMPGGGGRSSGQRQSMGTQTLVLIAGAAVVLIVVSVVITGVFMAGKPEAKPATAVVPAPAATPQTASPKVLVQAPALSVIVPEKAPPAAVATPIPTTAPIVQAKPVATPVPTQAPLVRAAAPTPVPAPAATTAAADTAQARNDLVQGIIDRFRISGVRTSGADSKALIDGHVYRVNDIVEKTIGLRLVKVESDHLTFTDRNGDTYTRSF